MVKLCSDKSTKKGGSSIIAFGTCGLLSFPALTACTSNLLLFWEHVVGAQMHKLFFGGAQFLYSLSHNCIEFCFLCKYTSVQGISLYAQMLA